MSKQNWTIERVTKGDDEYAIVRLNGREVLMTLWFDESELDLINEAKAKIASERD